MSDKPLRYKYDEKSDTMTIEGVHYSGNLFRCWGDRGMSLGSCFRLQGRQDGIVTLEIVDPTRIKAGPFPIEVECEKCKHVTKGEVTVDFENPQGGGK